jgi:hypothetical protein
VPATVRPVPKLRVPIELPGAKVLPAFTLTAGVIVPLPLRVPPVPLKETDFDSAVAEL